MPFLYGNHILKAHLGRITEDTPEHQGVVVYSMNDVPLVNRAQFCMASHPLIPVLLCRDSGSLRGQQLIRVNWTRRQSLYFIKRMSFWFFHLLFVSSKISRDVGEYLRDEVKIKISKHLIDRLTLIVRTHYSEDYCS